MAMKLLSIINSPVIILIIESSFQLKVFPTFPVSLVNDRSIVEIIINRRSKITKQNRFVLFLRF